MREELEMRGKTVGKKKKKKMEINEKSKNCNRGHKGF